VLCHELMGEESWGTHCEDPLPTGWPLCAGNWVAALNTQSSSKFYLSSLKLLPTRPASLGLGMCKVT